jgi:hypothetical protein
MPMVEFAEAELRRAGLFDPSSDFDGELGPAVLELVKLFGGQGHSGGSAALVIDLLDRLLRYQPLTPLTGEPDEWTDVAEVSGKPLWQNKRCGSVFREGDGQAYQIDARVFREPDGVTFTSRNSRMPIKAFPYTPIQEYVDVPAGAGATGPDSEVPF